MKPNSIRDFVQVSDGRIGLIVANDQCGGVFRGHCKIWFGEMCSDVPVVEHLCIQADWKLVKEAEKT